MDMPVHLGLSILQWFLVWLCKTKIWWKSKILLYGYRQFHSLHKNRWYLGIYKDIAENVETRLDNSNYELDIPFRQEKNKNVAGLMKDELWGKIMTKFVGLRAKTNRYLIDDGSEDKKAKGTKTWVIKK